jgi:hypothetical protein
MCPLPGVFLIDDGRKLFRDFGILACNLVELGGVARQADPDFVRAFGSNRSIVSLAKVSKFSMEGISFFGEIHQRSSSDLYFSRWLRDIVVKNW